MGIDAVILVVAKGDKPTDEQIARWSWWLAQAIGPEKFLLRDGLPASEYRERRHAWQAAFHAHPLAEGDRWKFDRDTHQRILDDLGPVPELRRRAMELSGETDVAYEEEGELEGEVGRYYAQDGPTLRADPGEWFLRLSIMGSYYGVGYERGDLLAYCAMAEWIEASIPNSEVWYGGDSSGVLAERFDESARAALRSHLYGARGRDYFREMSFTPPGTFPTPKPCSLCIPDEPRFLQHGAGPSYIGVNCGGCGKFFESRDNGKSWQVEEQGD
jgi:hypothetical protein